MAKLNRFEPIIATPNRPGYIEFAPAASLEDSVRCFWMSKEDKNFPGNNWVIPDLCADIIFRIDRQTGRILEQFFVAPSDQLFLGKENPDGEFTFGMRFFMWEVSRFVRPGFRMAVNGVYDAEEAFEGFAELSRTKLAEVTNVMEIKAILEQFFMQKEKLVRHDAFLNGIDFLLAEQNCNQDVVKHTAVSRRQLERLFKTNMGVTPKQAANLIRFQKVWRDIYFGKASSLADLAAKHAFVDQAHLTHQFKRYAGVTPFEMQQKFAKDVAFLQSKF